MRRALGETLMSALGVLLLIGALVAFDPRVRDRIGTALDNTAQTTAISAVVTQVGSAVLDSARDQSIEHAPLLIFGVAAAVLVTFMLRT